jgi:hypothetical protein
MKKEIKKKLGRPFGIKLQLDTKAIEEMSSKGFTVAEVAAHMGCNPDTLYVNYPENLKKGRDIGNGSVKRRLFQLCEEKNLGAIIWYMKNQCGWKDKQPDELENTVINVKINEVPK